MDLFLDEEVPRPIKIKIAQRMKEIESLPRIHTSGVMTVPRGRYDGTSFDHVSEVSRQAPSMQRIMEANPDLIPTIKPPSPVTPAAAAALQAREAMIQEAVTKGRKGNSLK